MCVHNYTTTSKIPPLKLLTTWYISINLFKLKDLLQQFVGIGLLEKKYGNLSTAILQLLENFQREYLQCGTSLFQPTEMNIITLTYWQPKHLLHCPGIPLYCTVLPFYSITLKWGYLCIKDTWICPNNSLRWNFTSWKEATPLIRILVPRCLK